MEFFFVKSALYSDFYMWIYCDTNFSELLPERLERSIENGRARKEKLDFEKHLLHAHEQLEQGQQLALQVQMEHERERQVLGRNGVACTKKTNPKNVSLLWLYDFL